MFLRNAWYAAGFSDEFGRNLLARTFLNEAVVIFRTQDGKAIAIEDRCAHRRLPLSMGRLIGDQVQCGYHGLVYDCSGRCVKIPGQTAKSIPPARASADLPGRRPAFLPVDLDGRSRARGPGPDSGLQPDRRARRRSASDQAAREVQLSADRRQSARPVPPALRPLHDHGQPAACPRTRSSRRCEPATRCRSSVGSATSCRHRRSSSSAGYQGRVNLWQVSEYSPPSTFGWATARPMRAFRSARRATSGVTARGASTSCMGSRRKPKGRRTSSATSRSCPTFGDEAAIAEFLRQNDQIITEDRDIFAVQQRRSTPIIADFPL